MNLKTGLWCWFCAGKSRCNRKIVDHSALWFQNKGILVVVSLSLETEAGYWAPPCSCDSCFVILIFLIRFLGFLRFSLNGPYRPACLARQTSLKWPKRSHHRYSFPKAEHDVLLPGCGYEPTLKTNLLNFHLVRRSISVFIQSVKKCFFQAHLSPAQTASIFQ